MFHSWKVHRPSRKAKSSGGWRDPSRWINRPKGLHAALDVSCPLLVCGLMPLHTAGALRDAEYTLHSADDTPGDTTNRATDGSADRTGGPIADGGSLFGTAYDSLRLNGGRSGKNGEANRGKQNTCF